MQSAATAEKEETLVTAEALRELTLTKEQLFDQQKENILQSLMSSMVGVATKNGSSVYSANLDPKFDAKLLAAIVERLEGLGYKVETESKTADESKQLGAHLTLSVIWAK